MVRCMTDHIRAIALRLAAATGHDARTVSAVLEGRGRRSSRLAVERAARELNITLPAGTARAA